MDVDHVHRQGRYAPSSAATVRLKIYDIVGREVMTLLDGHHEAGNVTLHWTPASQAGQPLANGVYFCQLQVGEHVETRQMTLIR